MSHLSLDCNVCIGLLVEGPAQSACILCALLLLVFSALLHPKAPFHSGPLVSGALLCDLVHVLKVEDMGPYLSLWQELP